MPRLGQIDPTTDTGPGADFLNGPLKAKQLNIFKGIAVNAKVLEAFVKFNGAVKAGSLTPAEHEIVALISSEKRNCQYCLAAHTKIAEGLGVDEETALGVRRGTGDSEKRQALIDFTIAMLDTDGFVTDAQLTEFKAAGYDDAAVIEVIGELAVIGFTNMFNHVNETEIDFPVAATV